MIKTITGEHALRLAEQHGLQLVDTERHNAPLSRELGRSLLHVSFHRPGVIVRFGGQYVDEAGKRVRKEHREAECYFRGWIYLGPDRFGIEPKWVAA